MPCMIAWRASRARRERAFLGASSSQSSGFVACGSSIIGSSTQLSGLTSSGSSICVGDGGEA
eukprot:5062958-Pleurochrysis_carterae.AAC.2